jgi:uncharacterized Zn-finger protein
MYFIFVVMGLYPKNRKPAGYRICPHCGESFKARGLGTHIREAHKMLYKTVVSTVVDDSSNVVNTTVTDSSNVPITKVASEITGKDLSECKRPDGKHFYTDQDLRILTARLILQTYNSTTEVPLFSQFEFMDIIADFESRFKCRFDDVRKANNHGKISVDMGTTPPEHITFAKEYGSLKYSM